MASQCEIWASKIDSNYRSITSNSQFCPTENESLEHAKRELRNAENQVIYWRKEVESIEQRLQEYNDDSVYKADETVDLLPRRGIAKLLVSCCQFLLDRHENPNRRHELPWAKIENGRELGRLYKVEDFSDIKSLDQLQMIAIGNAVELFGYQYSPAWGGTQLPIINKNLSLKDCRRSVCKLFNIPFPEEVSLPRAKEVANKVSAKKKKQPSRQSINPKREVSRAIQSLRSLFLSVRMDPAIFPRLFGRPSLMNKSTFTRQVSRISGLPSILVDRPTISIKAKLHRRATREIHAALSQEFNE